MRSRRGLSSVVGMVFAIIAIVTTIGYVTFSLNTLDNYNQSVLAKNQMLIDTIKEKFDIYSIQTTPNGKFNITISNTGSLPINITKMWVQNTTTNTVDWINSYYCHNCAVSPGSILKNIGQAMPVGSNPSNTYNLKLVTSRGNSMQYSIGAPSVKPIFLRLQMQPPTLRPFENVTLFLTVTNNMTSTNFLPNISPSLPVCNPSASMILKSGPNPTNYTSLGNGQTASFEWTYTAATAVNNTKITCSTYLNRAPSNTVSDTAIVMTSARGLNRMDMDDNGLVIRNPATTFGYTIAGSAITANRTLNLPVTTATETLAVAPQVNFTGPFNSTATASTAPKLYANGANPLLTITPHTTGNIEITVSGTACNTVAAASNGIRISILGSTSFLGANGAAEPAGTGITGGILRFNATTVAGGCVPFSKTVDKTGLTTGTKYFIDISQAAITGGTVFLKNVVAFAKEFFILGVNQFQFYNFNWTVKAF